MRDPKRIDEFLGLLEEAWKDAPDLRFGQLVYNIFSMSGYIGDNFYVEDDEALECLEYWLERTKN